MANESRTNNFCTLEHARDSLDVVGVNINLEVVHDGLGVGIVIGDGILLGVCCGQVTHLQAGESA